MNTLNRAVGFGEYGRIGFGNDAFPFMYNFVHARDDTWVPGNTGSYNLNLAGSYITVLNKTTKRLYLQLDADSNFLMKWIKISCLYNYTVGGKLIWTESVPATIAWDDYLANPQTAMERSLLKYIQMKIYDNTTGNIILDPSGMTTQQFSTAFIPWNQKTFQGYHFGEGQVYTQYLFSKDGTIRIDLTNNFTNPICVGGIVYGWKVRY